MAVRNVNIGSVKGMRSDWGAGDNLQIFNEQFKISKGKTKTGEWAEEAGFRRVNIESVQRGAGGEFTQVKVRFENRTAMSPVSATLRHEPKASNPKGLALSRLANDKAVGS